MRKADALPDALSDLAAIPATDATGSYTIPRGPRPSATFETTESGMKLVTGDRATEDDCGTWDPINGLRSNAQIRQSAREILKARRAEESRIQERMRSRQ